MNVSTRGLTINKVILCSNYSCFNTSNTTTTSNTTNNATTININSTNNNLNIANNNTNNSIYFYSAIEPMLNCMLYCILIIKTTSNDYLFQIITSSFVFLSI